MLHCRLSSAVKDDEGVERLIIKADKAEAGAGADRQTGSSRVVNFGGSGGNPPPRAPSLPTSTTHHSTHTHQAALLKYVLSWWGVVLGHAVAASKCATI